MDKKDCKHYDDCEYRNAIGYCPQYCMQYKHKDEVRVVRCAECQSCKVILDIIGNPSLHCKLSYGMPQVDYDDYCSRGKKING